jgi:signal transduction histidine kinase
VENYRKLTRLPQPDKKPIKVGQLLEKTITLINYESLNELVQITWKTNPLDLEILADKEQISQVLINLIKNSLEALKNLAEGKILLSGEINANGRVQISVSDNGPGISEDLMDKIFIPFFTTKESGSGVGLSLSRQIMMLHGGSLKVVSVPGKLTQAILEF